MAIKYNIYVEICKKCNVCFGFQSGDRFSQSVLCGFSCVFNVDQGGKMCVNFAMTNKKTHFR